MISNNIAALEALAGSINAARLQANIIDEAAATDGVYGDLSAALKKTLALILGSEDAAEAAYQTILDGEDVEHALKVAFRELPAEPAPLKFRKIETGVGAAYQTFSADGAICFTVFREQHDAAYRKTHGLSAWAFEIHHAKSVAGILVPDYERLAIVTRTGVDTRAEGYAYCQGFNASTEGLYTSRRRLAAWDAVFPREA